MSFQEPKKSASEEIAAGLFDSKTQMYKNALFSCIGMLAFISACGLLWDYGYRRHFRKNNTEFGMLSDLSNMIFVYGTYYHEAPFMLQH